MTLLQPHLDTLSLFLALLVSHLAALICSVTIFFTRQAFRGARFWISAQALGVIALALTSLGTHDYGYLRMLGNTAYILSVQLFIHSMWTLKYEKGFNYWTYLLVTLAGIFFFLSGNLPVEIRMMVFSTLFGIQNLYLFALTIWQVKGKFRLAAWLAGIPFLLLGLGNTVRLAGILLLPQDPGNAVGGDLNNVIYLLGIATSFLFFFGYYLLSSRHMEQTLADTKETLQQKNLDLQRLNQDNNTIISLIAHDLASPVASAARLVKNHLSTPGLPEEKKAEYCQVLGDYLDFSQDLLQKVLIWARSSHESFTFKPRIIDRELFVQEILPPLANQAKAKGITFTADIPDFASQEFCTDPGVLTLLVTNLCMNALKFTPRGGQVGLSCHTSPAEGFSCSVTDSGTGMDESTLKRIMSPGSNFSSRGTEGENGSGLGLQLCRNFLGRCGGRIEASSIPGKGSVFTFTIPSSPVDSGT